LVLLSSVTVQQQFELWTEESLGLCVCSSKFWRKTILLLLVDIWIIVRHRDLLWYFIFLWIEIIFSSCWRQARAHSNLSGPALIGNHWSTAGQWRERHATGGSPRDFPAKIPAHNRDKGLYLQTGRRRMPILVTGAPTSRKSTSVRSRHPTDHIVTRLLLLPSCSTSGHRTPPA